MCYILQILRSAVTEKCLIGGYTGSSESTLVKMPHWWKSHVTAHLSLRQTPASAIIGKRRGNFFHGKMCHTHGLNPSPPDLLIGQPQDAQPDLRLNCSHRYKAVVSRSLPHILCAGWTSTSHQFAKQGVVLPLLLVDYQLFNWCRTNEPRASGTWDDPSTRNHKTSKVQRK